MNNNYIDVIDTLKIEKDDLKSIKNLLHRLEYIPPATLSLMFDNNVLKIFFLVVTLYKVSSTEKNIKINDISVIREKRKILENTEYYQELDTLYKAYLKDLGNFITSVDLKKSLDIAIFYQYLHNEGFLSFNKNLEYHKFKYNNEWSTSLLGSRVSTGGVVCRHSAALLTDIYKELGIDSYNLVVDAKTEEEVKPKTKHLVCGVVEDNKKYIYDPTSFDIASFNKKRIKYINNNTFATSIRKNINYKLDKFNKVYKDFYKKENVDVTKEDFAESLSKTINLSLTKDKEIECFYHDTELMLMRMGYLNKMLFPYGDEEITKCLIK